MTSKKQTNENNIISLTSTKWLGDVLDKIILFNSSGVRCFDMFRLVISLTVLIPILIIGAIIRWIINFMWWTWYDVKKKFKRI